MIHISSSAYIFYISAQDVAHNNLKACCDRIIETFESTPFHDWQRDEQNRRPLIYIFVEQPNYKWESEVRRWMKKLEDHFEPEILVHSFILPIPVYREMSEKHSDTQSAPPS